MFEFSISALYASGALKPGLTVVRKVSSVRGTRYFELALRLPLWPALVSVQRGIGAGMQ